MRFDPHIRERYADPPLVPGTIRRFSWPEPYDPDVVMIRNNVQEEGKGLFVLPLPIGEGKCVVEAYYPEDIRGDYALTGLDPYRRHDMGAGHLVVIHILWTLARELTWPQIAEIRRNNRSLNRDLKRMATASYQKLALTDDHDARDAKVLNNFSDWYEEAMRDTVKFAMTPHSGQYRSSSLRQ